MAKQETYQHHINLIPGLLIAFFIISISSFLYAQDETSIRTLISEGDLKKLAKADGYKSDADNLIEEANRLNMEVFTVQANPELDEKTIKKRTTQLENEAQQKHVQASLLYEKCNEIKFALYKQYIDNFWKSHEGEESNYLNEKLLEEQASDNYFQAASYRIEAKKMDDGYAMVEKLNEANNLEIQAIQKQITALGTYHGMGESAAQEVSVAETTPDNVTIEPAEQTPVAPTEQAVDYAPVVTAEQPVEQQPVTDLPVAVASPEKLSERSLPGNMSINQSMIDSYNRYISTGQFTDSTLSTGQIAGITSFDTDRMLQLWYEYVYGRGSMEPEPALAEASDSAQVAEANEPAQVAEVEQQTVQPVADKSTDTEIGIVTDENRSQLVPSDDEVVYRVQIAANRSELSQRALSKMYYGNKNVEMINENGWFKYSVGDFYSYEEASKFRKSSGISNAFVVAYRKGTRFAPGATETAKASQGVFTPAGEQKLPAGLIFRIQVAASRIPLTIGQLKRIYQGDYPVEMIAEEGWYKYQFMGVRLYSDALQIVRNVATNGVFIVAYEDGIKINLAEAVMKNKELENTVKSVGRKGHLQEIEFHLQLAASRVPMNPDELKMIYSGLDPISVIYEEGWYKYHLKAGNSSEIVEQFKQSLGIPKAFIVPYRRAAKINYYEAIQELK